MISKPCHVNHVAGFFAFGNRKEKERMVDGKQEFLKGIE